MSSDHLRRFFSNVSITADSAARRYYGFDRQRAAATRHAGWRTCADILTRLLVTRAGLRNDQGVGAGGAERRQGDDDREGEPPHQASVALVRPEPLTPSLTLPPPYFYVPTLDSARTR